jgi:hypothetical protein
MPEHPFYLIEDRDIAYVERLKHCLYAAIATPQYRRGEWLRDQAQALDALLRRVEPLGEEETP